MLAPLALTRAGSVAPISDKAVYLYAEILYECGAKLHHLHGPRDEALSYVNRMIERGHNSDNLKRLETELERLVRVRTWSWQRSPGSGTAGDVFQLADEHLKDRERLSEALAALAKNESLPAPQRERAAMPLARLGAERVRTEPNNASDKE